ncbi:hypothetical protein [Azotobacter chroococcum]|uniref:hypothetical protein n=1 Tax=Azotobacter chroococcum TaxID=353 RepID=UPI001B8B46B7|nr:hypothetical protein [Azotobacter chroococcum]
MHQHPAPVEAGQGLHTCVQAAFAPFHAVVRRHLPLCEDDILVCGIALGYEDTQAPENRLLTERQPVEEFASFHGFDAAAERVC